MKYAWSWKKLWPCENVFYKGSLRLREFGGQTIAWDFAVWAFSLLTVLNWSLTGSVDPFPAFTINKPGKLTDNVHSELITSDWCVVTEWPEHISVYEYTELYTRTSQCEQHFYRLPPIYMLHDVSRTCALGVETAVFDCEDPVCCRSSFNDSFTRLTFLLLWLINTSWTGSFQPWGRQGTKELIKPS